MNEFFPPTEAELEEIIKVLKERLEDPKYEEDWKNLYLQLEERQTQLKKFNNKKQFIMNPETHQKELSLLFADIVVVATPTENTNEVKTVIPREISRRELGHLFSLGMCAVKRSGAGVYDLRKAHLNFEN